MTQHEETPQARPDESPAVLYQDLAPQQQRQRWVELARLFLRLGLIAFGGPAAHVAMIEQEVVQQRRWMSREKLLDLLGITNLIPGPNSTELAIHIGYERAGWAGLLLAGSCFILPAMLIVWALAALYSHYQTLPQVGWLLYGIKPVIIAIVIQAVWNLGKKAIKDRWTAIAGLLALAAYFLHWNEILVLLGLGMLVLINRIWRSPAPPQAAWLLPLSGILPPASFFANLNTAPNWVRVFLFFLKIGSVLYGSGYVLLAFLQRDLVDRYHWLTSQQLLDAVAIGQFTPGPVFTTATFIGYLLAGNAGAIAGTIGIFLPAFVLVWVVNPWVPRLRQSRWASGFLDGVNAASLGLMAAVSWTLGQSALVDGVTLALALIGAIAVFRYQVNSTWLVLAGGLVGVLKHLVA